mgnify:CR=1 FL=1
MRVLSLFIALFALTPAVQAQELFVFANEGQSQDQQDLDTVQCQRMATDRTGFDPMATPTAISRIGFATSPGTAVLPTCSIALSTTKSPAPFPSPALTFNAPHWTPSSLDLRMSRSTSMASMCTCGVLVSS